METLIILILIGEVFTGTILLLLRNKQSQSGQHEQIKEYIELMKQHLTEKVSNLTSLTRERLDRMSDTMNRKLEQGFDKTNTTFQKIIERMAKIDVAQKNIEALSNNVLKLQDTLTDSKQKGLFGEIQLEHILSSTFGEKNKQYYEMEYSFPDRTRVDCVIHTPQGMICIDAKFPLKHRHELQKDETTSNKTFLQSVRQQIDSIQKKYGHQNNTLSSSLMFIPSEAIFASIHTQYYELVDYAHRHHVAIVSPTTLTAMITIVLSTIQSIETQKQAKVIQKELGKLQIEFGRFGERRNKFTKDIKTVHGDIDNIDITSGKIMKRFDNIQGLELEEKNQ